MNAETFGLVAGIAALSAGTIASFYLAAQMYKLWRGGNKAALVTLILIGVAGTFLVEGLTWPLCLLYGAEWPVDILIAWPAAAILWTILFALIATLPQAKREARQFLLG